LRLTAAKRYVDVDSTVDLDLDVDLRSARPASRRCGHRVDAALVADLTLPSVEPISDAGRDRSCTAGLGGAQQRSEVEVDGGVRRLRIASLPSTSTLESRSTSRSTFADVDVLVDVLVEVRRCRRAGRRAR
jgi:hypothetical protein